MKVFHQLSALAETVAAIDHRFDLTSYRVLLYVAAQKELNIPQSSVSRSIAYLSSIGTEFRNGLNFIYLEPNQDDRRQYLLRLTPEGRGLIEKLRKILES